MLLLKIWKLVLTLASPSILRVGSSPTEKMRRRMVEPANVQMPDGRGKVTIITNEIHIAIQTRADRRASRSARIEMQCRSNYYCCCCLCCYYDYHSTSNTTNTTTIFTTTNITTTSITRTTRSSQLQTRKKTKGKDGKNKT